MVLDAARGCERGGLSLTDNRFSDDAWGGKRVDGEVEGVHVGGVIFDIAIPVVARFLAQNVVPFVRPARGDRIVADNDGVNMGVRIWDSRNCQNEK